MVTGFHTKRDLGSTGLRWGITLLCALLVGANGADVVITSDPPGSGISAGCRELGITPLTLDLRSRQPVEITSLFGPLGPLTPTLTRGDAHFIPYLIKL